VDTERALDNASVVSESTTLDLNDVSEHGPSNEGDQLALVLAWSAGAGDASRSGETLLVPPRAEVVFGRSALERDDAERVSLVRQRPDHNEPTAPLDNPFVSRTQLRLRNHDGCLVVENVGRRPLFVDGRPVTRALVRPGQTVEIRQQLLFVCARRPERLAALRFLGKMPSTPFGEPDENAIVGETPAAWSLRDQIAFLAGRGGHVLLLGESGTGKELVAQAIHAGSSRGARKLVSRSAATFPATLIDAELFGNVANYPNVGMPERPGLIGAADGSTLFLDEIGELPTSLQAHLLRVLDGAGDYQRLGESKRRTADLRLIAATNRTLTELKSDLAARLGLRLQIPRLNERRSDVALIARHLLRKICREDAVIGRRFGGDDGEPRVSVALVRALLEHSYTTNVRELESLLWTSIGESTGDVVDLTSGVRDALAPAHREPGADARAMAREIGKEEIVASLARNGGKRELVWRELGMANRYVLKRLMKKHGLLASDDDE
jgi:two-component system nitrogen regulation response regulator GlnG/two-component system response regulator HydG